MKRGHIKQQEYIEEAIRQKKTRAAIEDRIFTDMLKIDRPHTTSARVLKKTFQQSVGGREGFRNVEERHNCKAT